MRQDLGKVFREGDEGLLKGLLSTCWMLAGSGQWRARAVWQLHLTERINEMFLESQLHLKIVNFRLLIQITTKS
jgi:hypothetical protein